MKNKPTFIIIHSCIILHFHWVHLTDSQQAKADTGTSTVVHLVDGCSALRPMAAKLSYTPGTLSSMPKNQPQVISNGSRCYTFSLIPTSHYPGMNYQPHSYIPPNLFDILFTFRVWLPRKQRKM